MTFRFLASLLHPMFGTAIRASLLSIISCLNIDPVWNFSNDVYSGGVFVESASIYTKDHQRCGTYAEMGKDSYEFYKSTGTYEALNAALEAEINLYANRPDLVGIMVSRRDWPARQDVCFITEKNIYHEVELQRFTHPLFEFRDKPGFVFMKLAHVDVYLKTGYHLVTVNDEDFRPSDSQIDMRLDPANTRGVQIRRRLAFCFAEHVPRGFVPRRLACAARFLRMDGDGAICRKIYKYLEDAE